MFQTQILALAIAIVYPNFAAAQVVNCGSTTRNTVISDDAFQSNKIRDTVLPALRDTICNFKGDAYCSGGQCSLQTIIQNGDNEVALRLNKKISDSAQSAQLGPCSGIMDQIISQCIDGTTKVTDGTVSHENVDYKISISSAEALIKGDALQKFFAPPERFNDDVIKQLPLGIQDILNNGVTTTSASPPPTSTPSIPNGGDTGTPNPASCISDVEGVIKNLNSNFGDKIDVNADQDKFVDFARGRDNPDDHDWWRLTSSGNAFLMFGKDPEHGGFSNAVPPIIKSDLVGFVERSKLFFCIRADPKLVVGPRNGGTDRSGIALGDSQVCLTDLDNYTKCTGRIPSAI